MRTALASLVMAFSLATLVASADSQPITPAATAASSPAAAHVPPPTQSNTNTTSVQQANAATPDRVTLSLDRDLVTFAKAAAWTGGIFITVFAFIAVGFFGWDVKQTRKAMYDARDDLRKRMDEIRKDHDDLNELKERLKKLGAELIEVAEKKPPGQPTAPTPAHPPSLSTTTLPSSEAEQAPTENQPGWGPLTSWTDENKKAYLRNVIGASEFEWSTLGTLARKTGIPGEAIWSLFANDPFVEQGTGRDGRLLLRIRPVSSSIGAAWRKTPKIGSAVRGFLWDPPSGRERKDGDGPSETTAAGR